MPRFLGSGYTVTVNGLALISVSFTLTQSLCWPRLTGVYDNLYWEGDIIATDTCCKGCFLDQGHLALVGVAFETSSSCAVIFDRSEYGLPLESVSSTRIYVGWLTVADVRPGPLT